MRNYRGRLVMPPEEQEIEYPYRREWRSLFIEGSITVLIMVGAFIVFGFIAVNVPSAARAPLNLLLLLAPVIAWLIISVLAERRVPLPRVRLLAVFVITALGARAIALPFAEAIFRTELWLPLTSAGNRIIGYTFTHGVVQEASKYLVQRFAVWDDHFRTRLDAVAYGAAAALGFTVAASLGFLLRDPMIAPAVFAAQILDYYSVNLAGSLLVAYGLAEMRFSRPTPFLMTIMVALAALIHGAAIPLRSGLINAGFSTLGSFTAPLFGIAFSVIMVLAVGLLAWFLFNAAERQAREMLAARE